MMEGASLGANSTIICGVTIESLHLSALVSVTKDEAYALVAGVPARQIGWMSEFVNEFHCPL